MNRRRRHHHHPIKHVKKHFTLYLATTSSVLGTAGIDYLIPLSLRWALVIAVSIFCAACVLRMKWSAVYYVETYHPATGKPVCGYIGETGQRTWTDKSGAIRYPRIEQHLIDNPYYGTKAKPWADTTVRWWFLYESRWSYKCVRLFLERRYIKILRPLYNHEWNLNNPRRIPIPEQHRQRALRDAGRKVGNR